VVPDVTTTYYLLLNDGFNTVEGSVTVEVIPLPIPDAGDDDTIFHGTYTMLYGSGTLGTGNYSWHWEPANKLINSYAQNPITIKLYETTLFRLTITDLTTGCESELEDLVTVFVSGGPLAVTAEATTPLICEGGGTILHALPTGGNPDYDFTWTSIPPGFSSNLQDPPVNPLQTTTYFVEVFDQYNTIESSVEVVVSSLPDVQLGNDILTCPFDTVVLAVDFPGMDYYWSNGTIGNSISVASTGIGFDVKQIWVEVTNADNCVGVDTVTVTFDFSQCFGVGEEDGGIGFILYPNPSQKGCIIAGRALRAAPGLKSLICMAEGSQSRKPARPPLKNTLEALTFPGSRKAFIQ
jgi:hypothetical protein